MFAWIKKLFAKKHPDDIITGRKAKKVIAKMEDKSLWLSNHGVVHNALCKWHRNCDGKEWDGEGEYDQCGLCGGVNPIVHRWNLK